MYMNGMLLRGGDREGESRRLSFGMEVGAGTGGSGSGDDLEASDVSRRKKRYHRHTARQIQELEAYDSSSPSSSTLPISFLEYAKSSSIFTLVLWIFFYLALPF